MSRFAVLALAAGLLHAVPAWADKEGLVLPPVDHAATLKECGGCHLVFQPQMLPARSWEKLMGGLSGHFGEDASLDPSLAKEITAYLTAHAADAPGGKEGARFLKGLAADAVPLRITETPYWKREHREIKESRFRDPKIKSAANCAACHKTAAKGEYLEEEEEGHE